jgi:hypothetical protein
MGMVKLHAEAGEKVKQLLLLLLLMRALLPSTVGKQGDAAETME